MDTQSKLLEIEARCIAHGIALHIIAHHLSPSLRAQLALAAQTVADLGLPYSVSDQQLVQIRQTLESLLATE